MTRPPISNGIGGIALLFALALTGCGEKKAPPVPADVPPATPPAKAEEKAPATPTYAVKQFANAAAALEHILHKTRPTAVGFGEFHQQTGTVSTLSALERFSDTLLPVIATRTSDLVVETWVSAGNCGAAEKKLTREVDEVSKRPEATENETVKLIKKAATLGVQPHVMELECDDYQKLQADGGVDYLGLLELVGKRLGEKAKQAMLFRDAERAKTNPSAGKNTPARTMVAIYGGAVHNDAAPADMWKTVTFGTDLKQFSSNRYVEIDLFVPEFVESSDIAQKEPWFTVFKEHVSPKSAVVIELTPSSYIIGFKKGVSNRRAVSSTQKE